jgi:hypothetical protein
MPTTSRGRTVDQISYRLMCDALRGFLRRAVKAGPGAVEGINSIGCWASAVLYTLLLDHPVDRQGRCRSCRRSNAMIRLPRCQIRIIASNWLLHQPDQATLLSHLANELGLGTAPPLGAGPPPDRSLLTITARINPGDTDVLPQIGTEPRDPSTPRHPTPAVPSPLPTRRFSRVGRPDPDHGGAGVHPDSPRPRRVPPSNGQPPSHPGRSLVITGGMPWPR